MTADEKKKILDKVKKCLALSASSNEHEAAAALRQARKLMEANGLDTSDVMAAGANESSSKSRVRECPSIWECLLAGKVAKGFGCELIFSTGFAGKPGAWSFIGVPPNEEIAAYAFKVLLRQCQKARAEYIKTRLKRCRKAVKTRRADIFCEGWVYTAVASIRPLVVPEQDANAIALFMNKHCGKTKTLEPRAAKPTKSAWNDYSAGRQDGKAAELHAGITPNDQKKLGASHA